MKWSIIPLIAIGISAFTPIHQEDLVPAVKTAKERVAPPCTHQVLYINYSSRTTNVQIVVPEGIVFNYTLAPYSSVTTPSFTSNTGGTIRFNFSYPSMSGPLIRKITLPDGVSYGCKYQPATTTPNGPGYNIGDGGCGTFKVELYETEGACRD